MPTEEVRITIRPFEPGDRNFILATCLKGLYYGETWYSDIPKLIFMKCYHDILEKLISNATVRVACLEDSPDVILGYCITRKVGDFNVLDYVFVKANFRRIGLAKRLISGPIHAVTHLTKLGKKLKPSYWAFNPFLL